MNKITITQTIRIKIGEQEHELSKEDAEALRDELNKILGVPVQPFDPSWIKEPAGEPPLRPYWTGTGTGPPTPEYFIPAPCKTQIPTDAEVTAAMESR